VNASDVAPKFLFGNNPAGLRELLRKAADRPELAYIVVEKRAGEIFAHSFAVLPTEFPRAALGNPTSQASRTLQIGRDVVDEVSMPILEGRGGVVRVAFWREQIDVEVTAAVTPVLWLLLFVTTAGIAAAIILTWRINRPIFRLIAAARAISSGDLDLPSPRLEDDGEFGDLSRAIERMRSSVKAAMIRLGRYPS
jgi:nitrogen fixation/metabolism regulation signal transduction histidine kinase